ncbi:acyl CoA:acetate/3-ketoacid CoA transferase [Terasakiella sp. A23]|uniref:acyl CoA:acetate/3-ketoacid CoA transferase n=1 Tax=Terasakiella sp. FCG-A23 TaxID=3080561 RepID=UPI0029541918|nr:acyl CoA:acetate/3-ketoacid CoA transferase [Terasakiella sp. A23]MDV7340610.1 acyl CoA:acetate/3-ketoacid CoA transferase [Terasakiella sp. A23]
MTDKIVSLTNAISKIKNGDTICTSGFVGIGTPDYLISGLELRYIETARPQNLSLVFAAGQGDGNKLGLNRLGHEGLLKRVIGGHWGLIPKIGQLALDNKVEAYNLPQGCISHLFRDIAGNKPGTFSKVGLQTFVDPRFEGGKMNTLTKQDLVEVQEIAGEEWLFYKSFPIDVALIRGTIADEAGNLTMSKEALTLDNLAMAMAAKNSGGIVIAQVEQVAEKGSLNPREVEVPGILVDYVVQAPEELHDQTYATHYNPAFSGQVRVPANNGAAMKLDARKIIARRAVEELPQTGVINLGIGMPEGLASVANEKGVLDGLTLTTEPGTIGGIPQSGLNFGAAVNLEALVDQNQQFDFYDGGGLDMACLGMAEVDGAGNVNVSRFNGCLAGCGGFINISQNSKKVVFVGTFTAGGLQIDIRDEALSILQEGRARKFVETVEQTTFNGGFAKVNDQTVIYITERCVFEMTRNGLKLTEIAPGIDLEKDILSQMNFTPIIDNPKTMDAQHFC